MSRLRRAAGTISAAYLAGGGAVLALSPLVAAPARNLLYVGVGLSAMVAVLVGIRRYRPAWAMPWWLLVGAVCAGLLSSLVRAAYVMVAGREPFPSVADLLYTLMLILLAASVAIWVRTGQRQGGTVEAGIVALGGAAVSWALVVEPLVDGGRFGGLRLGSYLAYAAVDLLILVLAARVALVSKIRTPAYAMVIAGAAVLVGTDTAYYASIATGSPVAGNALTAIGWLGAYVLLGGAALHPSMASSTGRVQSNATLVSAARLFTYGTLIVLSGALTVYSVLSTRDAERADWQLVGVPVVLGTGVSVLLMVRIAHLANLLNRRARLDPLTGLGNRTLLRDRLAAAREQPGALMVVNLDGFRDVNDSFGHHAGDLIILETARRLRRLAPAGTSVVRLGADEFALLVDGDQSGPLANTVLDGIRDPYRLVGGAVARLSASVGVRPLDATTDTAGALRDADEALVAAKGAGGDRWAVYDAARHAERVDRNRVAAQLQRAVGDGQLSLHYQPIVDLATGGISTAEALLRWTAPDGSSVPPSRFIPIAEQSGSIVPIGRWVLHQVCEDLRVWYPRHGLAVTANVSARQLRDPDFAATVLGMLRGAGLPGEALVIEVTETVLATSADDAATVIAQLQALRDVGVRVAVDDFGTGYSSLSYLRQLPVDILKMDGSFTADESAAFVGAIIDLAASLGLPTVAEAVETPAQADRLRELGCELAQGYHFARPAPAAELSALLVLPATRLLTANPSG